VAVLVHALVGAGAVPAGRAGVPRATVGGWS
jgi:hypothetical protein